MRKILLLLTLCLLLSPCDSVMAGYAILQSQHRAGVAVSDATTQFWTISGCIRSITTEGVRGTRFKSGNGTFKYGGVFVSANDVGSASTATVRDDVADTTLVISITANTTGLFSNNTNFPSVAASSFVNWEITVPSVGGSHSITVKNIFVSFLANSNTYNKILSSLSASGVSDPTVAAGTTYFTNGGGEIALSATEAPVQFTYRTAGTLQYMAIFCSANTANFITTIRSRINTGYGNQTISLAAGETGRYEDVTNTDTIASGDLVAAEFAGAAGTGTASIGHFGFEFLTTNNKSNAYTVSDSPVAHTAATTYYYPLMGGVLSATANTEDSSTQFTFPFTATVSNLKIYLTANAATGAGTFDFRIGGVSKTNTISITASTTGLFEDTTHSDAVAINNLCNYRLVVGTGGTSTVSQMGCMIEDTTVVGSAVKTVDGLAIASVKTGNGLATGSIKTWNGLA